MMRATVAPGMAAPLGSFTDPVILPPTCAKRAQAGTSVSDAMNDFERIKQVYAGGDFVRKAGKRLRE